MELDIQETSFEELSGRIQIQGLPEVFSLVAGESYLVGMGQLIDPQSRFVSKQHAQVVLDHTGVHIRDLGSTNGTKLMGRALTPHQWYAWSLGQTITVANVPLKLAVVDELTNETSALAFDPAPFFNRGIEYLSRNPHGAPDQNWWRRAMQDDALDVNDDQLKQLNTWLLGLGPLDDLLSCPDVSEIMVVGCDRIWVERGGKIEPSNQTFVDTEHLVRVIDRILAPMGRRVDQSSPMTDGRLPDGSRVNVVLPPISLEGPLLTIRRFQNQINDLAEWVAQGCLDGQIADQLADCVGQGRDVLVVGGTGAGKTTLLNALAEYIPDQDRIVSIEDAAELDLSHQHWVRLETRQSGTSGQGALNAKALLINALRMRPDRILLGEVRGGEALELIQALNTGHRGCMSTLHANSAESTTRRLEVLLMSAGIDWPLAAVREQIAQALDIVVALGRTPNGQRRVFEVAELVGFDQQQYVWNYLFRRDPNESKNHV